MKTKTLRRLHVAGGIVICIAVACYVYSLVMLFNSVDENLGKISASLAEIERALDELAHETSSLQQSMSDLASDVSDMADHVRRAE